MTYTISVRGEGRMLVVGIVAICCAASFVAARGSWMVSAEGYCANGPLVSSCEQPEWILRANAPAIEIEDHLGASIALFGETLVVGAPLSSGEAGADALCRGLKPVVGGAAYVYCLSAGEWTRRATLVPATYVVDERFGASVDIAGNTIVVGAARGGLHSGDMDPALELGAMTGQAYVFERKEGGWAQEAVLRPTMGPPTGGGYGYGKSVSIAGDIIAIGAGNEPADSPASSSGRGKRSGGVYVYSRTGGAWSLDSHLRPPGEARFSAFGHAVSLSGATLAVGAPRYDGALGLQDGGATLRSLNGVGAVHVYVQNGGRWVRQATLRAASLDTHDFFGYSVDLHGEFLVIGASNEDAGGEFDASAERKTPGAAYVFKRHEGQWRQEALLEYPGSKTGGHFGHGVAIYGNRTIVSGFSRPKPRGIYSYSPPGLPRPDLGVVYSYLREEGGWQLEAIFNGGPEGDTNGYGQSLVLNQDIIGVGAPLPPLPSSGFLRGAVQLFAAPKADR